MKHKTCIHVTSANEATRREFISSVLHGVASCYDGEVKVCPEYELSGSHVKGQWIGLSRLEIRLLSLPRLKGRILTRGSVRMQSSYKLRLSVIKETHI